MVAEWRRNAGEEISARNAREEETAGMEVAVAAPSSASLFVMALLSDRMEEEEEEAHSKKIQKESMY